MARQRKAPTTAPPETMVSRAGSAARDNPVAAGGAVVMGLTVCLIVANALGLQAERHPAPLFSTRDWSASAHLPDPADRPGIVTVHEISTLVLDLQVSLRKLQLYEGPLDGINGPATERAIRAFERRMGRVETGQATEALLALILLQGDAPLSTGSAVVPVPQPKPGRTGRMRPLRRRQRA